MRFLIDAHLPAALQPWLHARGHEADHAAFILSPTASDEEIAALAGTTRAWIISKDRDFISLARRHGTGLLWLRCGNLRKPNLFAWLQSVWPQVEARLGDRTDLIEVR